ncbi:efflux RND transporter permease subunit [Pantoea anthophila]|uniref:efflux RND transporter permease subunit n=2 Tax=Pantoea anthophila TaxID=470931 RepID=UPI00301E3BD1
MKKPAGFNLSGWALAHQQLVVFFMLLVMAAGVMSYEHLSRNEDPAFTIKTAVVSAQWPGADVNTMVQLVTDVLEQKVQELPSLDTVESETRAGQTVIYVNLRDDTPPSQVAGIWYQLRKKMQDVSPSLPQGVQGPAVNDEFDDTFGTIYGFTAEGFSARELRDRVDNLRRALATLPDIGKTRLLGVQEQQVVIAFSPQKLNGMGLDLQQVSDAINAQNEVVPAGSLRTDRENIALRVSGTLTSVDSLQAMTLHIGDRFIPLTDLATISLQPAEPPAPTFRVNGVPAIGLAVSMAASGNLLDFGQQLNQRMQTLAGQLPHGITMTRVADQSAVVKTAVSGFVRILGEAVVIVLAVSFISLGLRAGLVVAAAIPLVLAMTFTGMLLAGIGLQRISLGALIIALGLLVDDAMITVEAMVARLEAGDSKWQAATWAFKTTAFPMLTGTLVMIAGFIPVGFAASSAGEYCYSLFVVIALALLCSWVVAVIFSPLTGCWLLSAKLNHADPRPGVLMRGYHWLLEVTLRHRGVTVSAALAVLLVSLYATTFMQGEFFPASDRPELLVSLTLPASATQAETTRRTAQLEEVLRHDRDVASFSSYAGSGAIRFYLPMDVLLENENIAQLVVVARNLTVRDRLQRRLESRLGENFSDITTRVSPLELGPPVGWPLKYRLTGPDYGHVRLAASRLAALIARSPLTREVNLTAGEPERVMTLAVNQTEARAAGLSSGTIARALNTLMSGSVVTTLRDRNRLIDVVLRGNDAERQDTATLAGLMITNASGQKIPLRQVATLKWGVDDPVIWRRQRLPYITVQTDIAPGQRAEAVSQQLAPAIAALRASLPAGYTIEEAGTVAESDKGNSSVFALLPMTLCAMLVLLMIQLQRFSGMLLALSMAPFGLPGIVSAMLPTGTPLGFVALLGIIALAGIIIRNAVIMISEVDANARAGLAAGEAIRQAAHHRARPILLTACAAILGMIPIAHQVFWGPMALAIIGGLVSGTLVTLTVLPAALSLLMQRRSR